MNLKVLIPLKTNSTRLKNKNLRLFTNNLSLFDIKINQLLNYFKPCDIYVSSENLIVKELCNKYHCNFCLRDINLTRNDIPETDIVEGIVNSMDNKECDILWCPVTQPLFDEYDSIINIYKSDIFKNYDSLCVVQEFKHHLIDSNCNGINFNFGYWHKVTQELQKIYVVPWVCFLMRRDMINKCYYEIGRKPYLYCTNKTLIDIDTEEDFKLAQIVYKYKNNGV